MVTFLSAAAGAQFGDVFALLNIVLVVQVVLIVQVVLQRYFCSKCKLGVVFQP